MKILLIGARINPGSPFGGTKVSFENQVRYFRALKEHELEVFDLARLVENTNFVQKFFINSKKVFDVLRRFLISSDRFDLAIINISATAAVPAGVLFHLLLSKKSRVVVFRYFGGDFDVIYEKSGPLLRWFIQRTTFSADLVLFQTKKLTLKYEKFGNTHWYPTTREISPIGTQSESFASKIVFLGHVNAEKGIDAILALAASLPGTSFEIGGPLMDQKYCALFKKYRNVTYLGVVDSDEIPEIISPADFLILLSSRAGEGYPGVIIEAFQCGVPVIVSNLPSLTELVTHQSDGLIFDPTDTEAVSSTLKYYKSNVVEYLKLRKGAGLSGQKYRTKEVNDRLIDRILEI